MDVYECIVGRRSTRSFRKDDIPQASLDRILEAARWSPSAGNRQPWEFILIRKKETLENIAPLARYGEFIPEAPLAIAVVTDPSTKWHMIDGSSAVQNMALAAWEMGIGTCWIGSLEREQAKKILCIPEHLHLLTVLPFGYPDEVDESTRKSVGSMLHQEKW